MCYYNYPKGGHRGPLLRIFGFSASIIFLMWVSKVFIKYEGGGKKGDDRL